MKPIAVTLVMLGTLLLMTPAFSDHLVWQRVQALISHDRGNGATMYSYFAARMDNHYQLGYWSAGAAVIGLAFLIWRHRTPHQISAS